jgi:translation elongation factor EF-G
LVCLRGLFIVDVDTVYVPVEIQFHECATDGVYRCLSQRRCQVISQEQNFGAPSLTVKAYLPVVESFGFSGDLRTHTSGQAFSQHVFHHWETMDGSAFFLFTITIELYGSYF